jgi:hypothetical protein
MAVEQWEPLAEVVAGARWDILENMCNSLVERYYLPRQRGGTAASRRAKAEAAFVADLPRIFGGGQASDAEGAGE